MSPSRGLSRHADRIGRQGAAIDRDTDPFGKLPLADARNMRLDDASVILELVRQGGTAIFVEIGLRRD